MCSIKHGVSALINKQSFLSTHLDVRYISKIRVLLFTFCQFQVISPTVLALEIQPAHADQLLTHHVQ